MRAGFLLSYPSRQGNRESGGECRRWKKAGFTVDKRFTSCSKNIVQESVLKEKSLDLQVLEAYQEGKDYLENGDPLFAAKKFNEAEILFPQSEWAPKSALMAAYTYYSCLLYTSPRPRD